jgi:IS30 family transposase
MSNILEVPQQQAIQALIAKGWSVRRIARTLGILVCAKFCGKLLGH